MKNNAEQLRGAGEDHQECFSFSRLGSFEKCPKAYEYRYILEAEPDFETTIEAYMGTCVHEVLERAYRQPGATWRQFSAWYEQAWAAGGPEKARIVRRGTQADEYRRTGSDCLKAYHRTFYGQDDGETLGLEQEFFITLSNGERYRGFIDRIARMPNGVVRLIDYKSGKRVPNPATDMQLRSYALFALREHRQDAVEICYYDLRAARAKLATVHADDLPEIEAITVGNINRVKDATRFPAKPSILCGWCGYNQQCDDSYWEA
ncbi:MAG: PD-(D/E)XK nuclease family protein [Candidatus Marinimicrobia bacterium]|nr:PD-(D/E)XK nuclease family protein [Candidatus Neomarinimicrobiota bacterium]